MITNRYVAIAMIIRRDDADGFWNDCPIFRVAPVRHDNGHPVYLAAGNLENWVHIFDRREVVDMVFLARITMMGHSVVWMCDGEEEVECHVDVDYFEPVQSCEYRDSRGAFVDETMRYERVLSRTLGTLGVDRRKFELPTVTWHETTHILPLTTKHTDGWE